MKEIDVCNWNDAGSGEGVQRVPPHVRAQPSSGRGPSQERRGPEEGPHRLPGEAPAGAAQIRDPQVARRSETRSVIIFFFFFFFIIMNNTLNLFRFIQNNY